MKPDSVRILSSRVLLAASFSASAGPTVIKALQIKGVFNEKTTLASSGKLPSTTACCSTLTCPSCLVLAPP